MTPVEFICEGCGVSVITYRFLNLRTIPASMDGRNLCQSCKDKADRKKADYR